MSLIVTACAPPRVSREGNSPAFSFLDASFWVPITGITPFMPFGRASMLVVRGPFLLASNI